MNLSILVVFFDGNELNLCADDVTQANELANYYAAKEDVSYVGVCAYVD